ncbi:MAG: CHASE2 domain-containing protein [Deltaproteobacteria bacterium]|nr:CHASE2 domain-containing protein [Deltaproteobacteria bacterium]
MNKIRTSFIVDSIIGLLLTILALAAFYLSWTPLEELEYRLYDLGSGLREQASTSPVIIVAIDDDSIASIGRWPWPRGYIAQMINFLDAAQAKVIGVDIIYSENDFNQGLSEIRDIIKVVETDALIENHAKLTDTYIRLKESEKRLDNDAILMNAIVNSKKVVLPFFFMLGNTAGRNDKIEDYQKLNSLELPANSHAISAREAVFPIAEFSKKAFALGHINLLPDSDGSVRSEPLLIEYGNRLYPSYGLQLALKYLNYDLKELRISESVNIGRLTIPTDEKNRMLISFNTRFPYYSFVDVASERVPPNVFKDKIVIIAQSSVGLATMLTTPVGVNIPSWGIIANVVENILNQDHIYRPDWAFPLEIGIICFFGLFLAVGIPLMKARYSAIVSLILLVAWIAAGKYILITEGCWIKVVYPSILLIVGYIVIVSKRYLLTEKTKERIEADSVETNKMLGLSFQGQGMLDMAFDKFRKCPLEDLSVQELLYNLGLDFERKRQFNKAVAVYEHIGQFGDFKDIKDKIVKLKAAGDNLILTGGGRKEATVMIDSIDTKPTLGRYTIIKELGRGAMGAVFLGKDPRINREVAIKTLRYEEVDDEQLAEVKTRFFREAEAAGKLSHPNIVTIYDVGEDYDIAYMAMELLEGADLSKYCRKDNLLPLPEVIRIIRSVADALDYAHQRGVVHRDIKPANIMILNNGEVRVTDFGIARVMASSKTQTGMILGTPSYMSPEQISGQKVDGRSDLFSLGVVFCELLTGEKPFQGDSIATLMYSITTAPPPPLQELAPGLPDHCIHIIERLLAKNMDDRYNSGKDLAEDLARCLKS